MDQSTPTFPCPSCDKIYLTQHSLTRHSHNHKKTSEHTCPTCAVVFSRKDLLARHLKMVHDPLRGGNRSGRRLRCHTACVNCRDARIKCDSNKPCTSCSALSKTCIYSTKTARVSRKSQLNTDERLPEENADASENTPESVCDVADQSLQPGPLNDNVANFSVGDPDGLRSSMPQTNTFEGMEFNETSPSQMVAWPWLHEDLFLQSWDGFTGYDPSAIDLQSLSQLDAMQGFLGMDQIENGSSGLQTSNISSQTNNSISDVNNSMSQWNPDHALDASQQNNLLDAPRRAPPSGLNGFTLPPVRETTSNFHRSGGSTRVTSGQLSVVAELVAYARQASLEPLSRGGHITYWYSMSMRVREAFNMYSEESPNISAVHCLDHLVNLFRDNFWTLWPMIPAYSFDANNISPILYLAISSVGAMYGGSKASHFGVLLHEALRELLCEPLLDSDEADSNLLSLAQARLLTQVAALYFGQKRAFTYAQHLGSVLIAQARRMDLYSAPRYQRDLVQIPTSTQESPEVSKWLGRWLLAESRKRLAFGILRAEVYTSVLLNARPMLCADELTLELPCSNYLWLTKFMSDSQYVAAIRQDAMSNDYEKLNFADIVKITMERNEPMPPLNILSQELLVFGLQEHVWRICHDPDILSRLTGSHNEHEDSYNGLESPALVQEESLLWQNRRNGTLRSNSASHSLESQVTGRNRQMANLRSERKKTADALRTWRQSLKHGHNGDFSRSDRTSLMSGLLLFHISFLRIFAPIEKLHYISYRIGSDRGPDPAIVRSSWEWSKRGHAEIAVQHACIVWSLLSEECSRDERHRAWFNFLALLGLHHAAVVIWTYAGTHNGADGPEIEFGGRSGASEEKLPVVSGTSRALMTLFVRLYGHISPAWSVRSSFSATAARLASNAFPSLPPD